MNGRIKVLEIETGKLTTYDDFAGKRRISYWLKRNANSDLNDDGHETIDLETISGSVSQHSMEVSTGVLVDTHGPIRNK